MIIKVTKRNTPPSAVASVNSFCAFTRRRVLSTEVVKIDSIVSAWGRRGQINTKWEVACESFSDQRNTGTGRDLIQNKKKKEEEEGKEENDEEDEIR